LAGFNLTAAIKALGAAPVKASPPDSSCLPAAIPARKVPCPFSSVDGTISRGESEASARSMSSFV